MQIPSVWMQWCFILISLATIGVCVFSASASVGALFYFMGGKYEKEINCCSNHLHTNFGVAYLVGQDVHLEAFRDARLYQKTYPILMTPLKVFHLFQKVFSALMDRWWEDVHGCSMAQKVDIQLYNLVQGSCFLNNWCSIIVTLQGMRFNPEKSKSSFKLPFPKGVGSQWFSAG